MNGGHERGDFVLNEEMLIVAKSALPDTFSKVVAAKKLIISGSAASVATACETVGLSRSAYYKYKDCVFEYTESTGKIVAIHATLADKAGILSKFMSVLYESGANIMTVNQNIPIAGSAKVSASFRTDHLNRSVSEIIKILNTLDGVTSIERVTGE